MSIHTSKDKWTREATHQLIDLYREEPCLCSVEIVEYRRKATTLHKTAEHMFIYIYAFIHSYTHIL